MGLPLERFPDWPAAMDYEMALAYTGFGEAELRRQIKAGEIKFLTVGPNGKNVTTRAQLDGALRKVWAERSPTPSEDMDFGDD